MAFKKLNRPRRKAGISTPLATLGPASHNTSYLALNSAAADALGRPAAVYLEWDDEEYLLRLVACSPDTPDSYPLSKSGRFSVTGVMRQLGIDTSQSRPYPVRRDTRLSLIIDLSEAPTRKLS